MKKVFLTLVSLLLVVFVMAQAPNQFKYQAALRNADGAIMSNESVAIDISILQGSTQGTSVFTETHNVTTTAQGLVSLNIGSVSDFIERRYFSTLIFYKKTSYLMSKTFFCYVI